jgi:hypothetical protein
MNHKAIAELRAEGWTERFTASGTRLREAVENYRELGFEVTTVPLRETAGTECTVCLEDGQTMMILTRQATAPDD